jgi:hypothetical protein
MQSEVAAAVAEAVNRVLTPKAVTHKQGENSAAVRRGAVSAHRAMETA